MCNTCVFIKPYFQKGQIISAKNDWNSVIFENFILYKLYFFPYPSVRLGYRHIKTENAIISENKDFRWGDYSVETVLKNVIFFKNQNLAVRGAENSKVSLDLTQT